MFLLEGRCYSEENLDAYATSWVAGAHDDIPGYFADFSTLSVGPVLEITYYNPTTLHEVVVTHVPIVADSASQCVMQGDYAAFGPEQLSDYYEVGTWCLLVWVIVWGGKQVLAVFRSA